MYLNKIVVENIGPIEQMSMGMPFHGNGDPKPLVLVGTNGSGKTILLANIADAFHEFAAQHFQDALPTMGAGHHYFKISGDANTRAGASNAWCFLEFKDEPDIFQYLDMGGNSTLQTCKEKIGNLSNLNVQETPERKLTTYSDKFPTIFNGGVYVFFPTGRAESPHWLNSENSDVAQKFGLKRRFRNYLGKEFVVASAAQENKQWLLDVVLDNHIYKDPIMWENANKIIRVILQHPNARFAIGARTTGYRVAVADYPVNNQALPSIDHLSAGQAVLLNLCLTILRYGDRGKESNLQELRGIVLIDEVDAHLHTKLLHQALPNLIKLFPKIQFILTTHSPLFLIGMETVFEKDGVVIKEMPTGKELTAKDFSEYEAVVNCLDVASAIQTTTKNIVLFVEGQTDKIIIENAWKKLSPELEAPFEVVNAYDCFAIQNHMSREAIFKNSPDKIFIGMLDFDNAFECWERLKNKNGWTMDEARSEKNGLLLKHTKHQGYVFLLPVPDFRNDLASREFGKDSGITIELLFKDAIVGDFLRVEKLPGGGKKPVFNEEKKQKFAETTSNLLAEDFEGFRSVFTLIKEIAQPNGSAS